MAAGVSSEGIWGQVGLGRLCGVFVRGGFALRVEVAVKALFDVLLPSKRSGEKKMKIFEVRRIIRTEGIKAALTYVRTGT